MTDTTPNEDTDEWDEHEETVRFQKWRPTHLGEMALSTTIFIVVAVPVAHVMGYTLAGAAVAIAVLTAIQEALWRYRGYPELTPSRRLIDAVR